MLAAPPAPHSRLPVGEQRFSPHPSAAVPRAQLQLLDLPIELLRNTLSWSREMSRAFSSLESRASSSGTSTNRPRLIYWVSQQWTPRKCPSIPSWTLPDVSTKAIIATPSHFIQTVQTRRLHTRRLRRG